MSNCTESTIDPRTPIHRTVGWSADQVVRDRGDHVSGRTGWSSRQVVKDHATGQADNQDNSVGWSSSQIVKDHFDRPVGDAGWSGTQVVKDQGMTSDTAQPQNSVRRSVPEDRGQQHDRGFRNREADPALTAGR